jgi:predicted GNAT family N-acyltransferase
MILSNEIQKDIVLVPPDQTWDLRKRILRPEQKEDAAHFNCDDDPSCLHFAYKIKERIVTVATFYIESHPLLSAGTPYRLRGMATDTNFQGQGYGEKVILKAFEVLETKKCDLLWCNARLRAVPFYEKLGFRTIGDVFEISGIGPHKVMYKRFNPR